MALPTLPTSYSTVDRVLSTLPQLSNSNISSADLALFLGNAQAYMNAKLARRYVLPFSVDIPQLSQIQTEIAIYDFVAKRLFTAKQLADSPWPGTYKDALARLDALEEGRVSLVDSGGQIVSARTDKIEVWSNNMGYEPTFHEAGRLDQVQDPDKIDDIESDRGL